MCGILGGNIKSWNFKNAINALHHRGPDSQRILHLGDFTLGFARLAIIDLSSNADQPMSSNDNQVHIVFNGEIYGFKRLRQELDTEGSFFRSQSDTEVLLNAYLKWDDNFIDHIDGMFAIAIYDNRKKIIKLFRDRAGIKPLYYLCDNNLFAFASELKGITALCNDYDFKIDNSAIYDYLTYFYIPDPKSLYRNVCKLKPGHQLNYDIRKKEICNIKPYWKIKIDQPQKLLTIDETKEHLKYLIQTSVEDQIISDVPVGFFLSGGMDSSAIVAEASKACNDINTFTIGFDSVQESEIQHAQVVAELFETNHRSKILSFSKNNELMPQMKDWYDEPFADKSAIPTFLVSQFAKQHVTVALTGDGGDELFGGYSRYHRYKTLKFLKNWSPIRNTPYFSKMKRKFKFKSLGYRIFNFLTHFENDDLRVFSKILGHLNMFEKAIFADILQIPKDYDDLWFIRQYANNELSPLKRLQYIDFHTYLPCDILTKVDRVAMAVSLEARVPLLSRKIIEFAFSLPENIVFANNQLKGILRETYRKILPNNIISRPKRGFGIPLNYLEQNYNMPHIGLLSDVYNIKII